MSELSIFIEVVAGSRTGREACPALKRCKNFIVKVCPALSRCWNDPFSVLSGSMMLRSSSFLLRSVVVKGPVLAWKIAGVLFEGVHKNQSISL